MTSLLMPHPPVTASIGLEQSQRWRENVAKPLAGNSNVLLAVGTFLAAPLLRSADEAGGGTHVFGHSKLGKTLVSAIGQSVWGKPCVPGAGEGAFAHVGVDSRSDRRRPYCGVMSLGFQ